MTSTLRTRLRSMPSLAWARLIRFNILARTTGHQDFASFVAPASEAWTQALAAARSGPRVLIATNSGGHFALSAVDRLLAVALTVRGGNVTTVLCDGVLSACQVCELNMLPDVARFARHGPARLMCSYCHPPAAARLDALKLPLTTLGDHLTDADRSAAWEWAQRIPAGQIRTATWEAMGAGEHAYAGALRYFARGTLEGVPYAEPILRRYLVASIETAMAYQRMIEVLRPDVVVVHHGIYTPQGIVAEVARARGVRVVTWNPAYRRHCFIFSHDDTYHHTLMNEPVERWAEYPLDARQRADIVAYLRSRRDGDEDWIRFHKDPDYKASADLGGLGIDSSKPYWVAFTNVFWDAQLHYPANAFADQREWLIETVRWFAQRPELQLVIRVHPAELSGSPPSRELAVDIIRETFSALPPNVVVIPPDSAVSSYVLAERANAALIYGTKMGVELAAAGLPVIVAGEAWVRNKGVTFDASSKTEYFAMLSSLPFRKSVDADRRERALAYAYHFFFRRMIPLAFVQPEPGARRFTVALDSLRGLMPGADPGLDVVCQGILRGTPFEMAVVD